ncbi:MAG: hypothetical protein OER88_05175 [Planctomycetota bacterium]|nr:hypothetical protein [Planctomycetota bacterium]
MPICAHCGDVFPSGKLVCPGCGADADMTWSPDTTPTEFLVEDERMGDEEYEDFLRGEGLADQPGTRRKPFGCALLALAAVSGLAGVLLL